MTITLHKTKETKGTIVFSAEDPDAAVTTLYIRKHRGFDGVPTVTLQVTAVDGAEPGEGALREHNYQRRGE